MMPCFPRFISGHTHLHAFTHLFPSSCFLLESCVEILMKCDKFPAAHSDAPSSSGEPGKVLTCIEEAAGRLCRTSGLSLLMLTHLFTVCLFDLSAEDTDNTRWASLPACTSCSCMRVCVCVSLTLLYFSFLSLHIDLRSSCPLSVWRTRDGAACLGRLVPLCLHKSRILRGELKDRDYKRISFNSLSKSLFDNRMKTSWKEHLKHLVYAATKSHTSVSALQSSARIVCCANYTMSSVAPNRTLPFCTQQKWSF